MFKRTIPTASAMLAGILVLLGTLIPVRPLSDIRFVLIRWAVLLSAFALLLASINLLRVHLGRLRDGKHKIGSLLIILSFLASLGLVLWQGAGGEWPQYFLHYVLVPGEAALLALTGLTLLLAGIRAMQTRRNVGTLLFVGLTILFLFATIPYIYPPLLQTILQLLNTLAMSGTRGLAIGVALGITLTGLRVILGTDRPHSDE
ncbi:MAG TPA: hypothetical protein PKH77_06915 [Anaerolineae bacterium]|nr:hypothetical protein [Anaerolineae bacterium]